MTNWEVIKRVFGLFIEANGKKTIYIIILFSGIVAAFNYLEPLIFYGILKDIESFIKGSDNAFDMILISFAIWIGFIVLTTLTDYLYRVFLISKNVLKSEIYNAKFFGKKVINMQYSEYLKQKPGELFKKFDRGTERISDMMFTTFGHISRILIGNVIILSALLYINWEMTLALFAMMPIFILIGAYFNQKTGSLQDELNKDRNRGFGYMGDALSGFSLVKTLNSEKKFLDKIGNTIDEANIKQMKIMKRWSLASVYTGLIVMISRLIVIGTGIILVKAGEIGFADIVLYFQYASYVYFSLSFIFENLRPLQEQIKSAKELFEGYDNIPQDKDQGSGEIIKARGEIEFKNVSFEYVKGKSVINKLSFKIKPGEKVALVGSTGSGKSTITNLLLRFWDINEGKILYDKKDIREISKSSLRDHMGIVMQDNSLFNGTIRENLLLAKEDTTDKELEEALKKAHAEFVLKNKEGLDTEIGERGLKLSGGEKQRISIARIILKNPEVLILDEATSALDNTTELLIQDSLNELMENKTSIIIAHRLSTIKKVDKVIVLDNGKIVEEGKYEELIEKKGKLFELANPDKVYIS